MNGISSIEAVTAAGALKALVRPENFDRWEIAGAVRRGEAIGASVVHVVQPFAGGLFDPAHQTLPKIWQRLDCLETLRAATAENREKWKPHFRSYKFQGWRHDVVLADADNWGLVLLAATGPRAFTDQVRAAIERTNAKLTEDWHLVTPAGELIPVPTEAKACALAGVPEGVRRG